MSYRALARSAPLTFFPLGFLARLSYAITPLGTLLVIQHATGSHSFAGLAAGAQSLAIAVAGFAAGGLATRFGARRLGMTLAVLNALAAALLVATSTAGARPAMVGTAVLVGLTQPHVGLLVRVHWSHALGRGTTTLRTAFAYESAADELSFVIGPVVVGLFALIRPGDGPMAAVGAIFGSIQAATAAHSAGESGFLYACLGAGSAVSGIAYGWLPRAFALNTRYLVFSATLVLGMVFLALSPWPPLGILVAGFAIAPYMITLYTLTDALAPPSRLPVAIAALGAGGPVGTAVGQALTGALVNGPGLGVAWLVPAGCASVGLLVALVWLRSAGPRPRPGCPTGRRVSRGRPTPPVPSS